MAALAVWVVVDLAMLTGLAEAHVRRTKRRA
jgi:hypothetical protein